MARRTVKTAKDITTLRSTLEFLKREGELLTFMDEVDPIYEVSGITKSLDDGPALLFDNVKGYPNARIVTNVFSRIERVAKIFDVADPRELKFKGLEALNNPIPPRIVAGGPCQEVVQTKDIDVPATLPILKYTETDPGRIIGGGNVLTRFPGDNLCIAFKRTHFRRKDWASLSFNPMGHLEHILLECRAQGKTFPITMNFWPSPAVVCLAATGLIQAAFPVATNELAIAGALQGRPVEVCKALTVDTYAIADAEWVIEGYIDPSQIVWESDEAEKVGEITEPFFPEYHGHEGRAWRNYKFQATAITHRRDRPIFAAPNAHHFELCNMQSLVHMAALFQYLERVSPGLVVDVNIPHSLKGFDGLVIQVNKRRRRDDDFIPNLIHAAFAASTTVRLVVIVDEDVDIYNADEILWAITERANEEEDFVLAPQTARGRESRPTVAPRRWRRKAINASVPFAEKWVYWRGQYPKVNLERWLSREQIAQIRAQQREYARVLAEKAV